MDRLGPQAVRSMVQDVSDEPVLRFEPDAQLAEGWPEFRRRPGSVRAKQMHVPFECVTVDGNVARGGPGDWVAVDAVGFPYPVSARVFDRAWAPVEP